MKKLLLFLPILLAGCVDGQFTSRERNEQCEDIQEIEVFQTLNDGALAFVCERKSYNDCAMGHTVFVYKERNIELWDKKRIKAPKGKCIAYNGVYKYTSKDERDRTVPVVSFEYEHAPASEKELSERMDEFHTTLSDTCLDEANAEFKNQTAKNKKTCDCFADLIIEKVIYVATSENATEHDIKSEKFAKDLVKESEKKCGKLPKNLKF